MLEDYRDLLAAPPNDQQAQRMLSILSAAILTALRTLPHTPENEEVRKLLDMGMVMAMYEKIAHVMPRQEFLQEVEYMMKEEKRKVLFHSDTEGLLS